MDLPKSVKNSPEEGMKVWKSCVSLNLTLCERCTEHYNSSPKTLTLSHCASDVLIAFSVTCAADHPTEWFVHASLSAIPSMAARCWLHVIPDCTGFHLNGPTIEAELSFVYLASTDVCLGVNLGKWGAVTNRGNIRGSIFSECVFVYHKLVLCVFLRPNRRVELYVLLVKDLQRWCFCMSHAHTDASGCKERFDIICSSILTT